MSINCVPVIDYMCKLYVDSSLVMLWRMT